MPRKARQQGESDIYHVIERGAGRQVIFEDSVDRRAYLLRLKQLLEEYEATLLAWCLMDNHVHLLIKVSFAGLSSMMQRLGTGYAQYFNKRHEHVGFLFQNRFFSQPVDSDAYLQAVLRYIHMNPVKDGLCRSCGQYRWSSFHEFLAQDQGLCDKRYVLELLGSRRDFLALHRDGADDGLPELHLPAIRPADADLLLCLNRLLKEYNVADIRLLPREDRDRVIRELKSMGATNKQVERLTGVGRGIVERL